MQVKMPICHSLKDIELFLDDHKNLKCCLYLAYKTDSEWDKSTSRVYMNQIDAHFVYLPVNIQKEDYGLIKDVYKLSEKSSQIVAINQTQPHKNNPVLKERFRGQDVPSNVDALVKDQDGALCPFDLNGPSFIDWFKSEPGDFNGRDVVMLGIGGVGEPIARKVCKENPRSLWLIDIVSKHSLANELSGVAAIPISYARCLEEIPPLLPEGVIFINCAGKEGVSETGIEDFLREHSSHKNIFVDLRPHLEIEIVKTAQALGWQAYTGFGMNARNDYTLLSKICELACLNQPSFTDFQKLVALAS